MKGPISPRPSLSTFEVIAVQMTRLSSTVPKGDRLESLKSLRDRLAEEIDQCTQARDTAALSNRLMDVLAQIDELDPAKPVEAKVNPIDEVAKRRAARKSSSSNRANPAR